MNTMKFSVKVTGVREAVVTLSIDDKTFLELTVDRDQMVRLADMFGEAYDGARQVLKTMKPPLRFDVTGEQAVMIPELVFAPGTAIDEAAQQAIEYARETGRVVMFKFNSVMVIVGEHDLIGDVERQYYATLGTGAR